ncbi:MAG: S-layer homology domain-containing protein, partial [Clostridia bacterium]|nr:S-layer homology domain-containing protein [Clostridia bacterium]
MSNKIKKLICSLLAAAMLVTSAGVVSMAAPEGETAATETTVTETAGDSSTANQTDEEKETPSTEATETTAEATEAPAAAEATEAPVAEATAAPEATVAPEATEAPVVVATGSDYEYDDYYKKSLALCSSLGIISGFEDGSVKPEETVTRAQMASIVLRMLALDGTSPYQNIFTDVDSSHWAANQIQSAYEASIVSGMGDGTFAPDAEVTYAQVIVMLVNAMNYREDAEYYGGWQQGYIKEAGELELLKNAPGSADVASDRVVVIKMDYNALLADYKEVRTYDEYGQPKYSTDKTLAEVKFDVIEKTGKLVGTGKTSLIGDLQDGEVAIIPDKEDNAVTYDTKLTDLEEYLAMKVKYYYKENAGLTSEVVA